MLSKSFNDTYILNECQFIHTLLPTIINQYYWNLKTVSKNISI